MLKLLLHQVEIRFLSVGRVDPDFDFRLHLQNFLLDLSRCHNFARFSKLLLELTQLRETRELLLDMNQSLHLLIYAEFDLCYTLNLLLYIFLHLLDFIFLQLHHMGH